MCNIIDHYKKTHIKITEIYTPINSPKQLKHKRLTIPRVGMNVENLEPSNITRQMYNDPVTLKNRSTVSQKVKIHTHHRIQ